MPYAFAIVSALLAVALTLLTLRPYVSRADLLRTGFGFLALLLLTAGIGLSGALMPVAVLIAFAGAFWTIAASRFRWTEG